MGNRRSEQITLLGTNGTGKTTLIKEMVEKANKSGRRALIITPDGVEWSDVEEIEPNKKLLKQGGFVGVRKIVYFTDEKTLVPIKDYYFDGLLIFDDCKAYFRSQTSETLLTILIRRRQKMRDIIIVAHGFTQIPPTYFTFNTMYILFKTVDNMQKRKDVMTNFDAAKLVVERVNKKAITEPHYKEILRV